MSKYLRLHLVSVYNFLLKCSEGNVLKMPQVIPQKQKRLPQILKPQEHMGAEPLQIVPIQVEAPQARQAGKSPLLEVRDAVVSQVKQVKAGEIPEVRAVDPLD